VRNPLAEAGFYIMLILLDLPILFVLHYLDKCKIGKGRPKEVLRAIMPYLKMAFKYGLLIRAQLFGYVYFVLSGVQKKVFIKTMLDLGSTS